MIAAPGVTRFVGAGGMEAARAVSEEMAEIYLERNMQLQIPGWDFQGACLGLDIRRVVETALRHSSIPVSPIKRRGSGRLAQAPCGHRWRALNRRWKHWLKAWGLVEERTMTIIHPLLASRSAPNYRQSWRLAGVWRRAINLMTESGELLTLHRQEWFRPRRMGASPRAIRCVMRWIMRQ